MFSNLISEKLESKEKLWFIPSTWAIRRNPRTIINLDNGRFRRTSFKMNEDLEKQGQVHINGNGENYNVNGNGEIHKITSAIDTLISPVPSPSIEKPTRDPSVAAVPFWPIAIIVTIVFLVHGWLAELLVISVVNNNYRLGWFFALLTVLGQWLPTIPKLGWRKTDGFRIEHGIVGVAHCVSLGMSNTGGMLVEYNTYSLFKSSKVVFVMIISWIIRNIINLTCNKQLIIFNMQLPTICIIME